MVHLLVLHCKYLQNAWYAQVQYVLATHVTQLQGVINKNIFTITKASEPFHH